MTDAPPPAPAPAAASPAPVNPGKTMGVVALVLSIIGLHLIGIIVGFIGLNQSKKVGQKNGFALAGIIIGFIGMVIVIALLVGGGALFGSLFGACAELGPGIHEVGGVTYTCG
ncbi:MAG: DUF4190 domain-containing protein [Microcella sp.]|uniref:DUF4190 domain-containing protein n=1 Tax=Microcella sp. TaxID=1913979 RepID=UPI0024C5FDC9|nr:DUF4190 domain-containing protein [Microcella sp.]UYN83100.1 MAG: DUF4190 domain-containing protein [Microcella sp.]